MSKSFQRFVIKFANILLRDAKQGNQPIELHLNNLLADTSYEMNSFKRYIESVADCKDLITTNTRQLMRGKEFPRVLVKGGNARKKRLQHTIRRW